MHTLGPTPNSPARTLDELPLRIRDIATLRGLGYSFREIGREFEVSPQAISLMLSRHRRALKSLRGAMQLHGLSPRAVNALGRHGIHTREEAVRKDVLSLLRGERNCGAKTRSEIERWMAGEAANLPSTVEYQASVAQAQAQATA